MNLDTQQSAPIFDQISKFLQSPVTPFTTPGHKRGANLNPQFTDVLSTEAFMRDISMSNGLDDRVESKQVRVRAEKLAAQAYAADGD